MGNPYLEKILNSNSYIRIFDINVNSDDLVWHRDAEDRIIESIGDTDWMIQIDNELPKKIDGKIFIPKNIYHRLIKGTSNLEIYLTKINI